nr:MAG TPA: hypothetical protein [Podoviridae sp. ctK5Q1]
MQITTNSSMLIKARYSSYHCNLPHSIVNLRHPHTLYPC